ncbi:hypothetical protein MG293_012059 [Ovis ammon polii]|uniref:Uncharacterized protein n=1 Tax=Ovis ammon polii TaxID=230172 RepID=A0AAD4U294_OVIAM|nr:hypothetical protein MG293_012059 [Ovis ammon polii]
MLLPQNTLGVSFRNKLVTGPLGKIAYPNRSSYEDTDYSKDNQTYSCRAIHHGALFSQFSASEDRRRESTEQFPVWVQSRKVSDNFTVKRTEGLYIWSQERYPLLLNREETKENRKADIFLTKRGKQACLSA